MRLAILSAVSLMLVGAAGSASAAEDVSKTLIDLEAKWSAASMTRDFKTVDMILASDWIGRGWNRKQSDKAKSMAEMMDSKNKLTKIKNHDVVVRVFGSVAVVQGFDDETSAESGKNTSGTYSWTDVFQNRNGQWMAVASQNTKVAPK